MISLNNLRRKNNKPLVMGIINITPDSFSDGGEFFDTDKAYNRAMEMYNNGAHIIDIGGESTRPGAIPVGDKEELARILPLIKKIKNQNDRIIISVDTRKSVVAEEALKAGADIVNDISAGLYDPFMIEVIKRYKPVYIIMHSSDIPERMQENPVDDEHILLVLLDFFRERLQYFSSNGILINDIIIDPGIGFGKTLMSNMAILRYLDVLSVFGRPLLIGASRKSFIGKIDSSSVGDRIGGSIAAALIAMEKGADIIRCHDIKETIQAITVFRQISDYQRA